MNTRNNGETTLGVAGTTISVNIAGSPDFIRCQVYLTGRSVANTPYLRFNNVSAAGSYAWNTMYITGTAVTDAQTANDTEIQLTGTGTSTTAMMGSINIMNMQTSNKVVDWNISGLEALNTNATTYKGGGGYYNAASKITSVQLVTSTGNFNAGSRLSCESR